MSALQVRPEYKYMENINSNKKLSNSKLAQIRQNIPNLVALNYLHRETNSLSICVMVICETDSPRIFGLTLSNPQIAGALSFFLIQHLNTYHLSDI
jgi:hypothetical protein